MGKIEKCEDVLNGVKVNWAGYEPPGGDQWQDTFNEKIKPMLKSSRESAMRELESVNRGRKTIVRMNELVGSLREQSRELAELMDNIGGVDGFAASVLGTVQSALPIVGAFVKGKMDADTSDRDIAEIEEDIKFFNAFDMLMAADAELDKMLYAMFMVEDKYRVKILRASCRMLVVVEESREAIRRSKSVVYSKIRGLLNPMIEMIDKAYLFTGVYLRQLKKDYAKNGISALAALEKPAVPSRSIPESPVKDPGALDSAAAG